MCLLKRKVVIQLWSMLFSHRHSWSIEIYRYLHGTSRRPDPYIRWIVLLVRNGGPPSTVDDPPLSYHGKGSWSVVRIRPWAWRSEIKILAGSTDEPSVDGSLLLYFRSLFPHIPTVKSWWLQRWSIVGLVFNSSWPINSEKSNFFSELWQSFYYGNIVQEFNWRRINPKKIIANNGSRRLGYRKLMELYRK